MTTLKIYGISDDLIEIEGGIREEFSPAGEYSILGFSDGTVLKIVYENDGYWRIRRLNEGRANYHHLEGFDVDDDYSDQVTLEGDISWVVCGAEWAK